jgi:DNA-binding transcriptional ArsR family regulator
MPRRSAHSWLVRTRPRSWPTRPRRWGDPSRLRIAVALQLGEELCVCDLAWITELSQNLVSHHVRTLRNAGLATSRRQGKLVMYRLTQAGQRLLMAVTGSAAPLAVEATETEVAS